MICFVVCHAGPADHFAAFAKELTQRGYNVEIHAAGPAIKKLEERDVKVIPFSLERGDETRIAQDLAHKCAGAATVITDVGHAFQITFQNVLHQYAPDTVRCAYYDNPESFVPGGYSATAAKVMKAASVVLFANAHLAKEPVYETLGQQVDLSAQRKVAIGYYPMQQAQRIADKRATQRAHMRKEFFAKHSLHDIGQKVLFYVGGNNEEYFEKAFPAFLHIITQAAQQKDLSNLVIALQQHPGAHDKNRDKLLLEEYARGQGHVHNMPRLVLSKNSSDDAQVISDGMLYYQTSMAAQFALAGIPTIQVGHEIFSDILLKNHLCPAVTDAAGFLQALDWITTTQPDESQHVAIQEALGVLPDWMDNIIHSSY